jgi:hypothetical protein
MVVLLQEHSIRFNCGVHRSHESYHEPMIAVQLASQLHPRGAYIPPHIAKSTHTPRGSGSALWICTQIKCVVPDAICSQHGACLLGGVIGRGYVEREYTRYNVEV